jgi:peptidoglycan hydrolase-like protein with peptidoglycan-binding domain
MAEENTTDNTKNKKDTTGLSQFDLDKIAGVGMSKKQAKVIDTTDIDKQIAALEKPASGSVYDKLAARYRSQGEGAVLRTQKNLANLFGPTVNLIQEREAAAQARFTLLKDKLPEFDSQWSRGMDSATRQMWEDIYASKGENITIQDGKLVWTSTGGKSKEIKTKSNALNNISSITEAPTEEKNIIKLQKNLQDLGYDIGSTGADGKYGPKTKAAYEKFLKEKESIQSEIDSAELEGVGETRVIDLNEIGDGPTTIDNLGIQKDIEIQDGIQVLINSDIEVTDPRYNQKINQLVRTLNSVGPKGIKSLIFDGFGASGDDVLTSVNTDSFIQQIIQNNPEDFGIKDINNLTEEEIANAYDIMRSRDVTYDYKNNEGTPQTLQSQYLQWYRNEIDTKVREGKKSKLIELKGGTGKGKGKEKGKATGEFSDYTSGFGTDDQVFLPSKPVNYKGKRVDAEEMQIIFENGQPSIQFFPNDSESKQQLTKSEVIKLLKDAYPNAKEEDIKNWVKNQISSSIKTANEDKEKVKTDTETTDDVDVDNQIDKLLLQNQNIGGREVSDYLLSYGNDDFVINSLNREYGDLGFTFRYSDKYKRKDKTVLGGPPVQESFSDFDTLDVYYDTDDGQQVFSVRFDRATEKKDIEASQTLVKIMKALYNDDKKVLKRIVDGEGDFPGLVR